MNRGGSPSSSYSSPLNRQFVIGYILKNSSHYMAYRLEIPPNGFSYRLNWRRPPEVGLHYGGAYLIIVFVNL